MTLMKTTTKTEAKKNKKKTQAELDNEALDAGMTEWERNYWATRED